MNFQNIFQLRLFKSKIIGYIDPVQCKITELALAGYNVKGAYSPLRAFFMRKISMHPHRYVELGRDTFRCAGYLLHRSANPSELHTNLLAEICEAPKLVKGAHSS
ncbi:hypothetical protein [Acinetobacter sp. BSP-53]|uniref:hypothetical protein n=1 Tax=Acinetobacter sp. BSP-53 TaxID=3344662 RepID=UPI00376F8577